VEKALVQAQTIELLDVGLVQMFRGEYISTTMMSTKKNIFDNWTKHWMCGNYHLVSK
jgi:hypothetical protein